MAEVKLQDAPQNVRTFFDKGVAAMERHNLVYAMDMFEAVLRIEPRLLEVRKRLLQCAIRKAKEHPAGKLQVATAMGRLMKASAQLKTNPLQALETTENLLRIAPFHVHFLKAHCEVAEAANLPEVALQTLDIIKAHIALTPALLKILAQLCRASELYDREYECRQDIAKLKPNDPTAQKELKDAAARLTMGSRGWQQARSYRDILHGGAKSAQSHKQDALENILERIKKEPDNPALHHAIADLLLRKKHYHEAIQALQKCVKLEEGSNPDTTSQLYRVRERLIGIEIAQAEDAEDAERVSALRKDLVALRIRHAAFRCECQPDDLQLRFEYGKLLFEDGHYTEAIPQLQLSQDNPQRRIRSLLYLARAFRAEGQIDIATSQLERIVNELPETGAEKKEALYELGLLLDERGNMDEATRCFRQIYAAERGYRDVAERLGLARVPDQP